MSYDYMFFKCAAPIGSYEELSEESTLPIGSRDEIKSLLAAVHSTTFWTSGTSGWLDPAGFIGAIELFADDGRCFSISRITADEVQNICDKTGLVAFDGQIMKLFVPTM